MTNDDDRRFLTRIVLRNYKSIAAANVSPSHVAFLVGPNGSGKSNFLDALRFVVESLRSTMDQALHERGGINEVRRRSAGHPNHFGIGLGFRFGQHRGSYEFEVAAKAAGAYEIRRENCAVWSLNAAADRHYFDVRNGQVRQSTLASPPRVLPRRLFLVAASGIEPFGHVYDALVGMGFYNLIPEVVRSLQPPSSGGLLARDGKNAAGVLADLAARSPTFKRRIEDYLARIVPGVVSVNRKALGTVETLEFGQQVRGARHPWRFTATNISDGTLRAFGVLLALFQGGGKDADNGRSLVGIEEPELALHPAAAGVLVDAIREASQHSQIIVTSHSADLLDAVQGSDESVLAVVAEDGVTRIGPLDEAGSSALKDNLYTAGELLRVDQLLPDPTKANLQPRQLPLFRSGAPPG